MLANFLIFSLTSGVGSVNITNVDNRILESSLNFVMLHRKPPTMKSEEHQSLGAPGRGAAGLCLQTGLGGATMSTT